MGFNQSTTRNTERNDWRRCADELFMKALQNRQLIPTSIVSDLMIGNDLSLEHARRLGELETTLQNASLKHFMFQDYVSNYCTSMILLSEAIIQSSRNELNLLRNNTQEYCKRGRNTLLMAISEFDICLQYLNQARVTTKNLVQILNEQRDDAAAAYYGLFQWFRDSTRLERLVSTLKKVESNVDLAQAVIEKARRYIHLEIQNCSDFKNEVLHLELYSSMQSYQNMKHSARNVKALAENFKKNFCSATS